MLYFYWNNQFMEDIKQRSKTIIGEFSWAKNQKDCTKNVATLNFTIKSTMI